MASVRVDLMDAKQGRLPPVCICCGNSTQQLVEHRFYYQPTWLVICNLILPAIVRWCLAYNSVVIPVPVCPGHVWRLKLPTLMGYGLAGILLLIVPVLLLLSIGQYYDALLAVGLLTLLFVLIALLAILVAQLITPRAYDITELFLGLTAVSDQFAGTARRGGRGLVASGGYENNPAPSMQPQPAYPAAGNSYGYAVRPASLGSWKLALIIGGSVMAVILVAVSIIAGVAMSFMPAKTSPIASLPPQDQSTVQSMSPSSPPSGSSPLSTSPVPSSTFTPPSSDSSFVPPQPTVSPRAKAAIEAAAAASGGHSNSDAAGTERSPAAAEPAQEPSSQAVDSSASGTKLASTETRRPRERGSASRAATTEPPEGERPEPPIHAMDLRTRKVVFPPNHVKIPATFDLRPGHPVWARQREGSFWHAAFVASVDGESVTVRYKGWSDFFNETLNRDMLCIDKSLLAVNRKSSGAAGAADTRGAASKLRTWSDVTGRYKVEAELVRVENGQVTLRKANGDRTTLPVERLSDADREFLRQNSPAQ